MRKPHGLTEEQDELRLQGLRILARWIVRAHLGLPQRGLRRAENAPSCEDRLWPSFDNLRGRPRGRRAHMAGKRLLLKVRLDPHRGVASDGPARHLPERVRAPGRPGVGLYVRAHEREAVAVVPDAAESAAESWALPGPRTCSSWRPSMRRRSSPPPHLLLGAAFLPEDFPQRLNRFKEITGLSWEGMAMCMGVDPRQLQRWRQGTKPCGDALFALFLLADCFPGGVRLLLREGRRPP